MYDEFDNKENEDRYDPKQPSAEDEVKTGQMYGEEDQLSETEEVQASTAGVGENRVPACRDVPQGFFQERGVRRRLLLRITERRR